MWELYFLTRLSSLVILFEIMVLVAIVILIISFALLLCNEGYCVTHCGNCFNTPREAFAHLIDKVSGKGTWDKNPYVFVYDFELVD